MKTIGKTVYERKPDKESVRNTEGAFIPLKDGRIMYAYTHYYNDGEDFSSSSIAACYSQDYGLHWSGEDII